MSDLITDEVFTDGQTNIAASNMNGIIGLARVQPDVIANKVASSTMNVADQILVLKTDNTLARARFDTIVNSTGSSLPLASTSQNGMMRQGSGVSTDYYGGDNQCHPLSSLLPAGVMVDYAGPNTPAGWLPCFGQSLLRSSYPALFAAIGGTWGAVDGTHFSLPLCQDRLPICAGSSYALGGLGGSGAVALAVGHLPSHAHTMGNHTHAGADHTHLMQAHGHTCAVVGSVGVTLGSSTIFQAVAGSTGPPNPGGTNFADRSLTTAGPSTNTTDATGSGVAFSIIPYYYAVYKIIKT